MGAKRMKTLMDKILMGLMTSMLKVSLETRITNSKHVSSSKTVVTAWKCMKVPGGRTGDEVYVLIGKRVYHYLTR